ncbi:3-dehydroquinate synthase [Blattabacterium cuenoti]|nr:3-dehydroquinate synthase [Blattabacterium cuenoti]
MNLCKKKTKIYFNDEAYCILNNYLVNQEYDQKNVFILVDDITYKHCFPIILSHVKFLNKSRIIKIRTGEKEKNIYTCIKICKFLEKFKATRKSLIINVGGGVITDIGGFVASIFKRGIPFINIPTTLLGMVDASIGYKTGVNLDSIKNEIGTFHIPELLIIDSLFLNTLSRIEIISGIAEMLKHGLIADKNFWIYINKFKVKIMEKNKEISDELIKKSIFIKNRIVTQDPKEKGLRKILNFGHTIGHALESYFMNKNTNTIKKEKILHGIAVAYGMIYESWISHKINGLPMVDYKEIQYSISSFYPKKKYVLSSLDVEKLFMIMEHDKKNEKNNIIFSLINRIGECSYNCEVPFSLIKESLLKCEF